MRVFNRLLAFVVALALLATSVIVIIEVIAARTNSGSVDHSLALDPELGPAQHLEGDQRRTGLAPSPRRSDCSSSSRS